MDNNYSMVVPLNNVMDLLHLASYTTILPKAKADS